MGMRTAARLIFGAPHAELEANVENLLELINEDILQYASRTTEDLSSSSSLILDTSASL